jgi:hypothetical protein
MENLEHRGTCHCGAVQFIFLAPSVVDAINCNCSICYKFGYLHYNVAHSDFRLLSGADAITEYRFNTEQAIHRFCKICGVKSFYSPRSHPDCYSINLRCVVDDTIKINQVLDFNGMEWEKNIESIRTTKATSHRTTAKIDL